MSLRSWGQSAALLLVCLLVTKAPGADEPAGKAKLAAKGVRVTHSGVSLSDEVEFTRGFADIAKLKRKLAAAQKELDAIQRLEEETQANVRERLRENIQINTQLAAVNPRDIISHNKLVGMANANASAINLMMHEQDASRKEVDAVRQTTNSAREDYVQRLLQLRAQADRMSKKYASLTKDQEVEAALREWNDANNTSIKFAPSHAFQAALKRLETLEKSVITENIPLRRDRNSFFASVVIDGTHAYEMIVDSGASLLTVPNHIAVECGIITSPSDPTVTLIIANGSRIKGKLTMLPSVRVGKFTAQNVQCAVLPADASEAKPLLGMSFLGRYKFEINSEASQLSLMTVESGTASRAKPKKTMKPAKRPFRRPVSSPDE